MLCHWPRPRCLDHTSLMSLYINFHPLMVIFDGVSALISPDWWLIFYLFIYLFICGWGAGDVLVPWFNVSCVLFSVALRWFIQYSMTSKTSSRIISLEVLGRLVEALQATGTFYWNHCRCQVHISGSTAGDRYILVEALQVTGTF